MSRYIDAEWIRNIYADFEHYENRDDWTTPISNVLAVIDDAPSIDIVRCRECKHWQTDWTPEEGVDDYHYCPMVDRSTFDDWHCADGERSRR